MVSAAQRLNIVAAQVESVAALVQRFKNIATQMVSAAQRFNIVAAQVENVAAPVQRFKGAQV